MFCPWRRPWESKMDSLQVSLLVLGLLLVIGAQTGESIHCHVCNSGADYEGRPCGDEFNSGDDYLQNCDTIARQIEGRNYTVCRKILQEVDNEKRVHRQCGTDWRPSRPCVDRTGSSGIKVTYCECNEDGCNSAPAFFSAPVLLLTALSALLALVLHS